MNGPRRGSRSVNRLASTSRSGNTLSSWDTTATPWRTASAVEPKRTSPVEAHRAGVGGERAGDDLHERRLAGAVLAQQGVHGAGADREVRAASATTPPYGFRTPCASSTQAVGAEVLVGVVELLLDLVLEVVRAALALFWRVMISSMLSFVTVSAPEFHTPSGRSLPSCLAVAIRLIAR